VVDISAFRTEPDDPPPPPTWAQRCRSNQDGIHPASRVMFCARCGHATLDTYGHQRKWCDATKALVDRSHFCCPGSCELVDGKAMDRSAPCHPDPDGIEAWVAAKDAEHANMAVWRQMVDGDTDA
jgi:hypothetical protein